MPTISAFYGIVIQMYFRDHQSGLNYINKNYLRTRGYVSHCRCLIL